MQVRQCLLDVVSGVERRVYGVGHMQQQQQQLQQQQMMVMKARQLQQMQQQSHQRMMPAPMYYTQPGVAMPNYGMYYPQMPVGYPMQQQMPMQIPAYYNPNTMVPYPHHPYGLPSTQTMMNPSTNMLSLSKLATKKPPAVLSTNVLANPHSPYVASHQLINYQLCLIKKEAKDSFGVTLRHESRSVLVAREELSTVPVATSTTSGSVATTIAPVQVPEKKPRRKRVAFDVLTVVEANKARVVSLPNNQKSPLQPGDIFVTINGRDVGGMTFGEACRFISTSSSKCSTTGEIRCVLTMARRKVPLPSGAGSLMTGASNNLRLPQSNPNMQAPPTAVPLVPFNVFGERVIGDFSSVEWCAIIQAFPIVFRSLTTGMALMPVAKKDVCTTIKQKDVYKIYLKQRSVESIQAKIAFEGKRINAEARQRADEYWRTEWEKEVKTDADNENNSLVDNYLTDAQRSALRSKARPSSGCKCGSKTHNFVSDAKCVLFRDVKHFCAKNSVRVDDDEKKIKGKKISTKGKGKLEAAYIRRFNQLREENAATKEEAEFVLKMEQQQSYGMKKAVFAPNSLCTMVISAVAAVMDLIPEDRQQLDSKEAEEDGKRMTVAPKEAVNEPNDSDDSDDEDLPLNALLKHPASSKRAASNSKLPSPKRAKQAESNNDSPNLKAVPSAYILAEILLHISKTFGHLFVEPTHPIYAWQQRHRSVITTPLPKNVMFAGNPRKPGTLSFENVRFVISEDRLARLRKSWLNRDQLKLAPQPTNEELRQWNDEWTITHLSSTATGLVHEIGVLENLGILKVLRSGSVVLVRGWETKISHMILSEMKDNWGPNMDVNNLHCIHEKITSSLDNVWQHDGDGWRHESDDLNDDDDLVYEDEEYELRRQIFLENYDAFVNSRKGVGEFGI